MDTRIQVSRPAVGVRCIDVVEREAALVRAREPARGEIVVEAPDRGGEGRPAAAQARTVLVLDDNAPILISTAQILSQAGLVPSIVRRARVALAVLDRCLFDLLIVDFFMPEMTGDEFVRRVREHANPAARGIPVLGLSGSYRTEALFARSGATSCIQKPLHERRLLEAVSRLLPPAAGEVARQGADR